LFYDYLNVKFGGNNCNNVFDKKDWIDPKVRPFVNYFSLSKLVKKIINIKHEINSKGMEMTTNNFSDLHLVSEY
jgi:hypothetical protein